MQRVSMVATSGVPVLLYGETGSGKEVIALSIHDQSARKGQPFIRVNCGAIAPDLIDSELFGHEQGAFTGSTSRHKGWFEQANGGTLFLDEVAELSPSAQVRLLRVLQEGEFCRVGGERSLKVDVRIIAATHGNLTGLIEGNHFRADLYYRLAVFPIVIPSLRERLGDFEELTSWFCKRAATRFGLKQVSATQRHIEVLRSYSWPGNVREFAAIIDRAVLLGEGKKLMVEAALGLIPAPVISGHPTEAPAIEMDPRKIEPLDIVVRRHIERALMVCNGRVEGPFGAAVQLEMNSNTLRSKARKLNINLSAFRKTSAEV